MADQTPPWSSTVAPCRHHQGEPNDREDQVPAGRVGHADSYTDIPEEVQDVYRLWRPSPLIRARRLEKALDTPAHIYSKYEGVSPAGSHKPNTSVPQAFYNARQGIKKLTTETGAGQWGTALAFACSIFGLECEVWQVRASYDAKPYPKTMMQVYGADVHPSPSDLTESGRKILENGAVEPRACPQSQCFDAGVLFARGEGILAAPEPTHAIAAAVAEAQGGKESGEEKVILTAVCDHGHLDLAAYDNHLADNLVDYGYPAAAAESALTRLPQINL
ncbi:MAG: pyridoxal-phosphate dependent enzyme [Actinomycetia bacterium]|nr:pyridoxal-phosphate dependent enzyme [Actinomycetes bacterium]